MTERATTRIAAWAGAAAALFLVLTPAAQAQKIVCWKDKSGKVIGCGDRVPPEFQQNESKILDNQGITRGTSVSAQEAARLKEEAQKKAAEKVEEDRRLAEQRRQDSALINTYTSDREIDQRRDRELQVVELQIVQLKASQKKAEDAYASALKRHEEFSKSGKPVPPRVADDLARTADEKKRSEARIAEKEKDKQDITRRYGEQKARYLELKGGSSGGAPAAPAPKK